MPQTHSFFTLVHRLKSKVPGEPNSYFPTAFRGEVASDMREGQVQIKPLTLCLGEVTDVLLGAVCAPNRIRPGASEAGDAPAECGTNPISVGPRPTASSVS